MERDSERERERVERMNETNKTKKYYDETKPKP